MGDQSKGPTGGGPAGNETVAPPATVDLDHTGPRDPESDEGEERVDLPGADPTGGSGAATASDASRRSERAAGVAFAVGTVAAFLVLLLVFGRDRWFLRDDWYFLTGRTATDVPGLFDPHGEHWTTLPILAFRALHAVFGLHSYLPYEALVIAAHLITATLLRVVMRRAGVNAWIATAAALAFVFFGAGNANVLWAFQITMVGSVAFGLGQLILIDHDGPADRRDVAALLCGAAVGSTVGIGTGVTVQRLEGAVPTSPPVDYQIAYGQRLLVTEPGLHLSIGPAFRATTFSLCTAEPGP